MVESAFIFIFPSAEKGFHLPIMKWIFSFGPIHPRSKHEERLYKNPDAEAEWQHLHGSGSMNGFSSAHAATILFHGIRKLVHGMAFQTGILNEIIILSPMLFCMGDYGVYFAGVF